MLNSSDRLTQIFSDLFWRKYEILYFRNVYEKIRRDFAQKTLVTKRKTRPLAPATSTAPFSYSSEVCPGALSSRQLPTVARGLTAPANNARQLPAPQMCRAGEPKSSTAPRPALSHFLSSSEETSRVSGLCQQFDCYGRRMLLT